MTHVCHTHTMVELFEGHGIHCLQHEDIAFPNERLPGIRATWFPGNPVGRLNVDVFLEDKRRLQESFAGFGKDDQDSLAEAMHNFCSNSLHVLLSALWDHHNDIATREIWQVGEHRFTAHIGPFGLRGAPRLPSNLFDAISSTIKSLPLQKRIYWFRHYYFRYQEHLTIEALCDGEPYQEGIDNLASLDWEQSEELYSVRNFLMLVPVVD